MGQAGTQLQLDGVGLAEVAGLVGGHPGVEPHRQGVLVLHGQVEVGVVVVEPLVQLLVILQQPVEPPNFL